MLSLRMLGGIGLSDARGQEVDALLRQPKRLALLTYLALPRPGTWHRRDTLLVVFWTELDQSRARTSLRNALYTLRQQLPDGTIRTRGDDEVSIDASLLTTDVAAMADLLAAGRAADALALYRGDLLPALYISDAPGFDQWLDMERTRLQALARQTAAAATEQSVACGDLATALAAARRGAELDPDDEAAARRWIRVLDRTGDRAQALAVYDRFRGHMRAEFDTQPSAETKALIEAIRSRVAPATLPEMLPDPPATERAALVLTPEHEANLPAVVPHIAETPDPRGNQRKRRWLWAAIAVVALVSGAGAALAWWPRPHPDPTRRLVVLPTENTTGDSTQDYVGAAIAEDVARRLQAGAEFTVRSGARAEWPAATERDLAAIAAGFGSNVLLRMELARVGDSLELRPTIVDVTSKAERQLRPRRFTPADLQDVASATAAAVAGAVFRRSLRPVPAKNANPESYRQMEMGYYQLLNAHNSDKAKELFAQAIATDQFNASAYAGLSSAWASQAVGERVPFDVAYEKAEAAAQRALALDPTQGSALVNLGFLRTMKYRNLSVGEALVRKAIAAEPANPEVFLVAGALYRHAWQWDKAADALRVARELDPLTPYYLERQAAVELCAGRPDRALRFLQDEIDVMPPDSSLRRVLIQTLARLGRFDDAIAAWKPLVPASNAARTERLASARGASGYWNARHADGETRLAKLQEPRNPGRAKVSTLAMTQARFAAGDIEGGYAALDAMLRTHDFALYRLPCMSDLDEVRDTPRFQAILALVGALPER